LPKLLIRDVKNQLLSLEVGKTVLCDNVVLSTNTSCFYSTQWVTMFYYYYYYYYYYTMFKVTRDSELFQGHCTKIKVMSMKCMLWWNSSLI